jgi:hypothetical protein
VKPDDRALIAKWASDAFEQKMIKRPLDLDSLFR